MMAICQQNYLIGGLIYRIISAIFHFGCILVAFKGGNMATLTIKNIPDELYERLKQSAAQQRRV